jgi:hypothetical protein
MKTWHRKLILLSGLLIPLLNQSARSQTVTVSTRDQFVKAVEQAKPGTTILIASGTYQGGLHFNRLHRHTTMPL